MNRTTFYEYFSDLYDVRNQFEDNLIESLVKHAEKILQEQDGLDDAHDLARRSALIFQPCLDEVLTLTGERGDPLFIKKLEEAMPSVFLQVVGVSENVPHTDYIVAFSVNAMFGLINKWRENGYDLPLGQYFEITQKLLSTGISGYLGQPLFS